MAVACFGERVQARESEKEGGVGARASSPCCEGCSGVLADGTDVVA